MIETVVCPICEEPVYITNKDKSKMTSAVLLRQRGWKSRHQEVLVHMACIKRPSEDENEKTG